MKTPSRLFLASQSPARRRLVKSLLRTSFPNLRLRTVTTEIDERRCESLFRRKHRVAKQMTLSQAKKLVLHLADKKRENAVLPSKKPSEFFVVGCDQMLFFSERGTRGIALGKPETHLRAQKMLRKLSGQRAYLLTAMSIECFGETSAAGKTSHSLQLIEMHFATLSDAEIEEVLLLDRPYGCAGSFKFEGHGANLFKSVKCDDPTGIQGISLMRLRAALLLPIY